MLCGGICLVVPRTGYGTITTSVWDRAVAVSEPRRIVTQRGRPRRYAAFSTGASATFLDEARPSWRDGEGGQEDEEEGDVISPPRSSIHLSTNPTSSPLRTYGCVAYDVSMLPLTANGQTRLRAAWSPPCARAPTDSRQDGRQDDQCYMRTASQSSTLAVPCSGAGTSSSRSRGHGVRPALRCEEAEEELKAGEE